MSDCDLSNSDEQKDAYMAWRRGEAVEVRTTMTGGWIAFSPTSTLHPHYTLRRKPKPTLRKFTPSEIPVGALIRDNGDARINLILSRDTAGYKVCSHGCEPVLYDVLISDSKPETQEFSVDMGKTWKPFGVLE